MGGILSDLNEYLFEQMDRLSNDDLSGDELDMEIRRAKSITNTATAIINNVDLAFRVKQHMDEYGSTTDSLGLLEDKV